jgi:hypothetical protein
VGCEFELEAIAHFLKAAIAGMFFCVNNVVVYRNALKKIWRSLLPSSSKPVTAATKLSYTACQATGTASKSAVRRRPASNFY